MKNLIWIIRVLRWKQFLPVLAVIFFGLLAGKGLIGEGYFNMHDDLQMMRQLEMEKCFFDLQIPCRWVPDMGYGFGYPLFNFYPPLPYLVGQGIRAIGFTFVDTVKILFIFSFVASGLTMYMLASEFFGIFGGVLASVFYIWAPYHSVDVYVRGAMNEAWALIWFPFIFWASYKLITEKKKEKSLIWVIELALAWFGLFTSHNLMVLIFSPLFAVWCLIWLFANKSWKRIPNLLIAGAWSFGLSAFFTIPVLLEKGKVATETLVVGYYEYTAHFANISQLLFSRFWGYGPSVWLADGDRMSFQIGWIHWILSLAVLAFLIVRILKTRRIELEVLLVGFFIASGWFAAFMAHSRSTPIWGLFNELKFVQFPWRFLTIVIFSFSFVSGWVGKRLPKIVGLGLIVGVLVYSWNYFLPERGKLGPLTDEKKFTGVAWDMQQTAGIYDYLPKAAKTAPKAPRGRAIDVVKGEGDIPMIEEGTDWAKAVVYMKEEGTIRINIIDFDGWRVMLDGEVVSHYIPENEEWGRMYLDLSGGRHEISVKLYDTMPRKIGNVISLLSWIGIIYLLFRLKKSPLKNIESKG